MPIEYNKNREISGTIKRPVLLRIPRWWEDRETLPPDHWCDRCGGEVYRPGQTLCRSCIEEMKLYLEEN